MTNPFRPNAIPSDAPDRIRIRIRTAAARDVESLGEYFERYLDRRGRPLHWAVGNLSKIVFDGLRGQPSI